MKDLLLKLMQMGINIEVVNDELQLSNIPPRFQESDLMIEIKTHKLEVIDYVKKRKQANTEIKAIAKASTKELYNASPQQRRLFFLHQIAPSSLFYNISQAYSIKGHLEIEQLKKSFQLLIERHETLRTSFSIVDKKVVQKISDEASFNLEYIKAGNETVDSVVTKFIRPFDLTENSLFRGGLIEVAQDEHILVLDMHHLISDGVSQQILIKEFAAAYNNKHLSKSNLQYKDYSEWVHDFPRDHWHSLKGFWMKTFANTPKPCQLPLDFSRPETKNYDGNTITFSVDKNITKQLYALAHSANTSLFTVLISAFSILLSKLTNQEDIVIGTPVSGRTHPDLDNIVGLFVNTLPIRLLPDAKLTYRSYLEQVSSGVLECFDHQDYPLEQLIDDLKLDRNLSHNPLFDVVFVLQNMEESAAAFEDIEISSYSLNNKSSKFDLTLAAAESSGIINFNFEFSKQLFKQETVERFAGYFRKILADIAQNENVVLEDVDMLSDDEKDFLLNVNNKLSVGYPKDKTIVDLFEEQVKQRPNAVAVVFEDKELTYQELNQRSNQLARILRAKGCVANMIVGLLTGRGHETVIAMLAILKAGGAYLPIDIDYPAERIQFILSNSGVELLVTDSSQADVITEYKHQCIFTDHIAMDAGDASNLELEISPDDLCYIIYTSGTTGKPKGAMIEHKNVVRLLFNDDFQFDFGPEDIWTMFHSHTFDFSVWEMYGALLYGGKLIIIKKEEALDPVKYLKILDTQKVTILNQTPTAFGNLIQEDLKREPSLSSLRYVIFGGEALQPFKLKRWYQNYPDVMLVNMFGITETTVHVTFKEITSYEIENNLPNVGKPIPCTSVYVFTPKMQLAPLGVIAELYVGGEGVARGYLNNPDLTLQRFLFNPYRPDERLYRTGDLGRILENGEIEYFGRADRQIQLRGFRIEPGEIEFHLSNHPSIDYTLVTLKNREDGTTYLCAYYIGKAVVPAGEIREYLQDKIPAYMIPSYFIPISHLPQTGNDKIDISKLPEPEVTTQADHAEPKTFLEKSFVKIWSEELSVKDLGVTDNFFAIGGDSLKAIGVIHRINTEFNCNLSIADLYKNQTIATLTTLMQSGLNYDIDDSYNAAIEELRSFQENYYRSENWDDSYEEVFPMSGIEKGMMFYSLKQSSDKQNIHDTSYHEQNTYKIANRNFDFNIFKQAVVLLIEKHSELRKIYDLKNFAHIIKKHIEPELNYIDVSDLHPDAQESFVLQSIEDEKLKTTGLDYSVLWRMNIFKIDDISYLLIFDMHHSLFDGWSLHSFITELNNTYKFLLTDSSFRPEKLQCSYEDHIVYELAEAKKTENISFWRDEMTGSSRLGFPRKRKDNTFSYKIFNLGEEMKSDLEHLAKKYNTSLKHICFGAYVNAMKLYTSETDIVVGLATNNRPLVSDSEKLLGCFLNSVPFRIAVPENISGGEYIKLIENKLRTLKSHERVPLEEIVQMTDHRSQGDNPFFDTFFNYVNFRVLNEMLGLDGEEKFSSPYQDKLDAVSYLNVNTFCEFHVLPDPFALCISYATAYFDESVIETLYQCFYHTLCQLIKNEDIPLSQIDIISPTDRHKLLNEFNDTAVAYPRDKTMIDLFEAQAERTPEATALIFGGERMSYKELSLRADGVASLLISHGVKQGEVVGLMSERSFGLLASLLGILKAGAAYMPLDPNYPADRISYMLEDSGASLLLSSASCKERFSAERDVIVIPCACAAIPEQQKIKSLALAEGLAYVIYTSGSTGRPKGVMIPHGAVVNFSKGMSDLIEFAGKTLLSVTTFSFDIFLLEWLLPLQHGGTVVLANDNEQYDPSLLQAAIVRNKVNMLQITPSLMKAVTEHAGSLKALGNLSDIMIGGEAFPAGLLQTLQQNTPARIFNMYGPTETTVWSSVKELTNEQEITIGKPIANTQVYILDKGNRLQPAGVAGELCISGDGLSRGYLNKPELTAERFIDHPYKAGEKLYRTGDLARWLPDGDIEHLGRLDDQVKIRGYRIELGEIENQLLSYENIKEAVVVAKDRSGEKYLVGYYVSAEPLDTASLKAHLSGVLPDYMIPQVYVQLESLPLTPNGKTDRKALPEPDYSSGTTYTAASTELEAKLVAIWSEVLQLEQEQISVTAGFFDLGGHSLKATTLMNRIYKELQVEVPLKAIFSHQNIRSLGEYISGLGKTAYQAIEKAVRKDYYALSSGQQRMYFLYELDRTSLAYNMPYVVELEGALDVERLNTAFRSLIARHESLRTTFEVSSGEVLQRINEKTDFTISHYQAEDTAATAAVITSFIRPFDLGTGPLIRIGLVKVSEDSHLLLADMHHIITDGVSQGILIRDFMELYEKGSLPALSLQYKDYSEWQHSQAQQELLNSQRTYWKEKFSGELSVLDLPADYNRPSVKNYQGSSQSFTLNREETKALKALGEKSEATLFMTLLSVLNVLLGKLGNQEDITIGTPVAGRYHGELEGIIGLFVNTLALRNHPKGKLSFREFLEEVKTNSLSGFEHQLYPYEELVNELELPRDTGRNPLFDVMFTFQNFRQDELQIPGLQLKFRDGDHGISKFDLTLIAVEAGEELQLTFEYSTSLFGAETIDRFISYFKHIVTEVTADAGKQLSQIDILSTGERNKLLNEFNATAVDYPRDKTIIDLFEAQAASTPDQTAIIFGKERMSYRELLLRADHEAAILIARGVKQDEVVGLMCERSFELLIGMFGIQKAGAAYMPLDPNYPADRISYMLQDSGARLLLSSASCKERFSGDQEVIAITAAASALPAATKIRSLAQADSLAYVIYTSGSTGRPKGVMIPHRAVTNFSKGMSDLIEFTGKTLLSVTTFSFDIFVLESLVPLQYGATVVLADDNEQHDPSLLQAAIVHNKVNMLQITPSLMKAVTEHAGSLKALGQLTDIMIGGEAFPAALLQTLQQNTSARIFNMYGPTETTVWSSVKELTNEQEITIGKPIANTQVYILNKGGQLQPAGVAGELCISGDGLSRGYLNKPELTAERFIDHPYKAGEKLYRTGDLARWLPDGDIEHLGRMDDQVKIRGYRIELGEIESQLLSHENIKEAVVVAKDRNGEKYLVGYYVSAQELDTASLKAHLSGVLPEYMIPQVYVQLESLPLTPNGKTDRKALPEPDYSTGTAYTGPATELEEKLTGIWSAVLQLDKEQISVTAGFFDLGGHSLKATTLVNMIYKELEVEVPLKAIFSHQDIRSLGGYISGLGKMTYQAIEKAVRKDHYALSSGQQRMYFLYELDRTSLAYNMPYVLELEGALDVERLNAAFRSLIERHESLRTTFEVVQGEVLQRINREADFTITHYEAVDAAATTAAITSFIRPFDLGTGPLVRIGLVKVSEDNHLLLADMHHIITDGVSQGILIRDFMELYEKGSLPALSLQYKDYSEWQHSLAQQEQLISQRSYWKERFSGELSILDLPLDHTRPSVKSYQGNSRTFTLNREETKALKALGEESGATLFMTLLSVLNVLLGKLSNQEDITIGTPIAGRYHAELEGIIGLFVNTLALRNQPKGGLSFREFLEEVKMSSLSGFEHQLYPYEELVNELELPRDTGRNPLFDVMFTFQNFRQDDLQIPGLQLKFRDADHGISKFDIEVTATVSEDELHFTFEYSTALFKAETIDRFISYLKRIVTEVTADANKQLSQIDILSTGERNRLLNEFNATAVDYPRDKTIIDLFEAQVERTPDNVAVVYGAHTLTYKELNEKADQLAAYLQQTEGVKTGDKIGLLLEREEELFPSIFGILKAGAVYVPLSVHYPSARLNTIISDAALKVLITRTQHIEALSPEMETGLLNLDTSEEKIKASPAAPQGRPGPSDLAYIIFTSGSTGQPKGVMIEHGSVVNRLHWMQEAYPLSSKDVLLQKTSLVFDVSVWELFWWSFTGASVCVPAPETEKDPVKLIAEIAGHGVTTIHFVPSMLSVFLDAAARDNTGRLNTLRQVFASGEALGAEQVNRFAGILYETSGTRLINLYGPTEATVDVTYYECDLSVKNEMIPIGKPIANTQMYVVDKNAALSPAGVAGELCISGVGLSRGYLNKPELTAERFIDHPYKAGEKLYRTGDLARWLPDGNIEYLGRIDNQVKIRGYRIELGEIENQLASHAEVREAVVMAREREGEKYLVGYYVSDDVLNIADLKAYLSKTLPEYMIPSYFVHLTAIPLSINGKADRKSLPKPELTIGESYIAPSNETERKLTAIWSEVLELDQDAISADANFFELGGHSIHAVQVTNKIQGVFSVEMGLRQIFESNTIAALARFIEYAQPGNESSIPKAERKQYYLTSPAQERMYFGYLLDPANTSRNISSIIELSKAPDVKQLEKAFQALIKRHSGLRTCFELTNEGVVQQIVPDVNFELKCFDLGNETLESRFMAFIQPFDLSQAPLIKAVVVKGASKNYLFIDIHHIVCDGASVNILTRDLRDLYLGKKLPELELEYIDFAEWVRKETENQRVHRNYWSNKLYGNLKRLNLPILQERELVENNAVSKMIFSIGNDLYRKIKSFSREAEVTDFMFFLSVYYLMLNKITGDQDVIIGTDAIGRSSKDLQEIVGTFVNILPLRVDVNGSGKYSRFLNQVKECVLEAFDHQAYPYDQIVSLVSSEIKQLVDVHFSFDNTIDNGQELEDLQFKNVAIEEEEGTDNRNTDVNNTQSAEYDLEVVVSENEERFQILFNYNSSLYDDDTIKIFIDIFINIIDNVISNPKIEIDKIGIESEVSIA